MILSLPTRINQDENGAKSMKIENIELERNEEAKETQNIKNNIDTPTTKNKNEPNQRHSVGSTSGGL